MISCKTDEPENTPDKDLTQFLTKNAEGMYVNSSPVMELNMDLHQVSVNTTKLIYRIQTDAQNNYINCKLASKPANIGDPTEIAVNMQIENNSTLKKYSVTLQKISQTKMWLWESSSKTGFIITMQ